MSPPVVVVELIRQGKIVSRTAVLPPPSMAVTFLIAPDGEGVVARDEQIEKPVSVIVNEGGAGAEGIICQTSLIGHFRECSIAVVAKQEVRPVVRDKNVRVAVIVVVANGHSHSVCAFARDAGLFCYVGKAQLTGGNQFVAENLIPGPMLFRNGKQGVVQGLCLVEDGSLQEVYVQVPVAIVIEQRHARSHDFGRVVGTCGPDKVVEIHSGSLSHVLENDVGRRRGSVPPACRPRPEGDHERRNREQPPEPAAAHQSHHGDWASSRFSSFWSCATSSPILRESALRQASRV